MKYLRNPMRRSKRRLKLFQLKQPSTYLSPQNLPLLSNWNPDDERNFMSKSHGHGRSLSLQIPTVTFQSPRQPTLHEILSGSAPSPWTLSAFMAYLSQNHCLETLEFTMDAAKYEKQYHTMISRSHPPSSNAPSLEVEYVRKMWAKLIDAYIRPNAPRELNLPSDVRDKLLSLPYATTTPDPAELVKAVQITYELMDQSVLMPFLNSITPSQSSEHPQTAWPGDSTSNSNSSNSERFSNKFPSSPRGRRNSMLSGDSNLSLISAISQRPTNHSHRPGCRISSFIFGSSPLASVTIEASDSSTDEEGSSSSPYDIITPPRTPSHASSGWKKMSAKLCHRKKTGAHRPSASIGHLNVPSLHEPRSNSSSSTSLTYTSSTSSLAPSSATSLAPSAKSLAPPSLTSPSLTPPLLAPPSLVL